MLVECGSICDALQVFNTLIYPNEYSWTSLITAYTERGNIQHALNLYWKMREACVHPSTHTFLALLKACARLKDIERGQEIHAEISRKGWERDHFLGNTLVDMYAKCGSFIRAQEVSDKLLARDVVSWTALMAGYAEHGLGDEALECFEQMQLEGVSPNVVTLVCSLKACGSVGAIDKGHEIHVEIANKGFDSDPFLGNTLVDMYAKCGSLAEARAALNKLLIQDVVSWNALISGYAEHGLGQEALNCFEQMKWGCVSPDAVTFVCILKACVNLGVDKGQEIHREIARKGLERDPFVGNTLIDMYAKSGLFANAHEVFINLSAQDVVSWNVLITGYVEQGLGEEALDCYEQMQLEGVSPNVVTFVCSLKACGSIGAVDKGRDIHIDIVRREFERDLFVGNTLVDMYAKCGLLANAREVFDKLLVRDVVAWSALIAGYAEHGAHEEAVNCFAQMKLEGVFPDAITLVYSLKACGSMGTIDKGQEIHVELARKGFERDPFLGSILVDMYAKCGCLAKAQEIFDKLPFRNVVLWTALIAGYAEHGLGEEALNCFQQMQLAGVSPDAVTFVCSLKACVSIGSIDKGRAIHAETASQGLERDPFVGNTLVEMYAKCGSFARALQVFGKLPVRNIVSWTALITGYAEQGLGEEALDCFEQMQLEGVSPNVVSWNALIAGYAQLGETEVVFHMLEGMIGTGIEPDGVTFLSVLTVCSHVGLVDKGQKYFETMSRDYGITPSIEHHTCIIDLIGRAGQLEEAVAMVEMMPFQPDLAVWHTVLSACQKWGNVELGRRAFEHAVRLDEKDAAAHVLMSNLYADVQMYQEGEKSSNGSK